MAAAEEEEESNSVWETDVGIELDLEALEDPIYPEQGEDKENNCGHENEAGSCLDLGDLEDHMAAEHESRVSVCLHD